jgi:hypothetical protein
MTGSVAGHDDPRRHEHRDTLPAGGKLAIISSNQQEASRRSHEQRGFARMARSAKAQWIDQSIAARRGTGWARKPVLHNLTEAVLGKFHYTIGPYSDPVLTVAPGDRIRIETRDAFEGAIRTERDKPTRRLRMPSSIRGMVPL